MNFWDTDELANQIVAVLRHPPLARTLKHNARAEVCKMSWHDAAVKLVNVYESLVLEDDSLLSTAT